MACNPSSLEAEAGRLSQVQGQPGTSGNDNKYTEYLVCPLTEYLTAYHGDYPAVTKTLAQGSRIPLANSILLSMTPGKPSPDPASSDGTTFLPISSLRDPSLGLGTSYSSAS